MLRLSDYTVNWYFWVRKYVTLISKREASDVIMIIST